MRTLATIFAIIFTITANAATFTVESNENTGIATLRTLVETANTGDTIQFDSVMDEISLFLSEPIIINKDLTIVGNGSELSIIDGQNNTRHFKVMPNITLNLSNVSLVNGNVASTNNNGGSILNNGTLNAVNCTFISNAAFNGAAIYTDGTYTLTNCSFNNNTSDNYGGCIFDNGFANTSIPTLTNCSFDNNYANNDGGAMYNKGYGGTSSPVSINCTFTNNVAGDDGGVVYNDGSYGISSPVFINCTFANNTATDKGGVIYSYGNMGISLPVIYNSILWNNTAASFPTLKMVSASAIINHSLIQEATCPSACNCIGENIFNEAPAFMDAANKDFRLSANSPAIDSGDDAIVNAESILTDMLGNSRVMDSQVDLGAYEAKFDCNGTYMGTASFDDCGFCSGGTTGVEANTMCSEIEINLNVVLEGAYDAVTGTMRTDLAAQGLIPTTSPYTAAPYNAPASDTLTVVPTNAVDWVMIEVRLNAEETLKSVNALLMADGSIKGLDGESNLMIQLPLNETYYLVVRHRNHLDVMTQVVTRTEMTLSYDLTNGVDKAYGTQQLKVSSDATTMMHTGDMNQDVSIQVSDFDQWRVNPAMLNVYNNADLNMDGSVQVADYDLWYINRSKVAPTQLSF